MYTFSDQAKQLANTFIIDRAAKDRVTEIARTAVVAAYRDIGSKVNWTYLKRATQLNLIAPYDTGTVQYTASTRIMTLFGGVWPIWIVSGNILMNRNVYAVQLRLSDTQVMLVADRSPVVDIPALTSYQAVKTEYLLPAGFLSILGLTEIERLWRLSPVSIEVMLARTQLWFSPSNSYYYCIYGAGNGRMLMKFSPPPALARTLDIVYQCSPRVPVMANVYLSGTLSATSGASTVTITPNSGSPGVPQNIVGCILRIGGQTVPDSPQSLNPPVEEHVVAAVSGNTITVQDTIGATYSSVKYIIDDPLDIEPFSMQTLFDRMCEARMHRYHQTTINRMVEAQTAEYKELGIARSVDSRLNPNAISNSLATTGVNEMLMGMVNNPGGTS